MKTRLIIKCSKHEQRAGAEAIEGFCNEWAETYRKAREQRTRAFQEYLKQKQTNAAEDPVEGSNSRRTVEDIPRAEHEARLKPE